MTVGISERVVWLHIFLATEVLCILEAVKNLCCPDRTLIFVLHLMQSGILFVHNFGCSFDSV